MTKLSLPLDNYDIIARLTPAIITVLPVLVVYHYLLSGIAGDFVRELSGKLFLGYIGVGTAWTYFVMQIVNRITGKYLEDRLFQNGRLLPTTEVLMPDDPTYSFTAKQEIAAKYRDEFHSDLPIFDNDFDNYGKRQRLNECVSKIRTRLKENSLVRRHNTEYGFIRNLGGGSIWAFVLTIINLIIFYFIVQNAVATNISFGLAILYGIVIIYSLFAIPYLGKKYAQILLEQFLNS